MQITHATIVRQAYGPDHVSLETDLPSPMFPFNAPLDLSFRCTRGTAEAYVAKHFPQLAEFGGVEVIIL